MTNPCVKFAGRFRCVVRNSCGEVKKDTGWFDNLITNQGLDLLGYAPGALSYPNSGNGSIYFGAVGTGNAPPAFTDRQLGTELAHVRASSSGGFASATYVAGPPAYWSGLISASFSQGAVVGNITEVGMGCLPSSGTTNIQVFNRALILDGGGNPTTLPVLATDSLTISYELRLYLDLTDHTYSLVIGGTTYSGTYRMSSVSSPSSFFANNVAGFDGGGPLAALVTSYYTGTIGPVTGTPTGTLALNVGNSGSFSYQPVYSNGTYTNTFSASIPANSGSAVSIGAIVFGTNQGRWQFSVSPTWNRAVYQSIISNFSVSWARYP